MLTGVVANIPEGSTRDYHVNLKAGLRRSKTVEVLIAVTNTDNAMPCTVSPLSLTFQPQEITDQPIVKTVSITASNNDIDEGSDATVNTCTLTHSIGSTLDPKYITNVGFQRFNVDVKNNDNADVNIWYNRNYKVKFLAFFLEEGNSFVYDLKLESQPTANVTIEIGISLDPLEGVVLPVDNVSITNSYGNGLYKAHHDNAVAHFSAKDTVKIVNCNDVSKNGLFSVSKAIAGNITLVSRFHGEPISNGNNDVTGCKIKKMLMHPFPQPRIISSSYLLTFTPSNWNVYQTVQLQSVDDEIAHDAAKFTIMHTVLSEDVVFQTKINALTSDILVVVDVGNDDSANILWGLVDNDLILVENGASKKLNLTGLKSQPVSDVLIRPVVPMQYRSIINVNPDHCVIKKSNWKGVQNIFEFSATSGALESTSVKIAFHSNSSDVKYTVSDNRVEVDVYISTMADMPTTNISRSPPQNFAWNIAMFEFHSPSTNVVKFIYRIDGKTAGEINCPSSRFCHSVSFETAHLAYGRHRLEGTSQSIVILTNF